jgi:hypothetical protein
MLVPSSRFSSESSMSLAIALRALASSQLATKTGVAAAGMRRKRDARENMLAPLGYATLGPGFKGLVLRRAREELTKC